MSFLKRVFGSKKPRLVEVGNVDAVCPNCGRRLEKKPARKKKCPHCGNYIYSRTRPIDEAKVLVAEAQIELIEEQWAIANGTHEEYLEEKKKFERQREALAESGVPDPTDEDVALSLLTQQLPGHQKNRDWGLYRNCRLKMGQIHDGRGDFKPALEAFLEVCYLDLCGPNNLGGFFEDDDPKEFPAFSTEFAWLAPAVVGFAHDAAAELDLTEDHVREMFFEMARAHHSTLKLPVAPQTAWESIVKQMYHWQEEVDT